MLDLFEGSTINTPSMLCLEDYLDALAFAESVGGLDGMIARADANAAVIADWVSHAMGRFPGGHAGDAVQHFRLPQDRRSGRAGAAVSLRAPNSRRRLAALLDAENVAKDIGAYRTAPPGLRIWTGGTVEKSDVEALMPWLDWAFAEVKRRIHQAARPDGVRSPHPARGKPASHPLPRGRGIGVRAWQHSTLSPGAGRDGARLWRCEGGG